ncbi:hypothetical protein ACLMJK_007762 [Lecanora helva]
MSAWQQWENKVLIDSRNNGESWPEISQKLPGRSVAGCKQRFNDVLGLGHDSWTDGEDEMLTDLAASKATLDEMADTLGNRSKTECKYRLKQLKSKAKPSEHANSNEIPSQHHRAPSVSGTDRLQAITRRQKVVWTKQEREMLEYLMSSGKSFTELTRAYPHHDINACYRYIMDHMKRVGTTKISDSVAMTQKDFEEGDKQSILDQLRISHPPQARHG